MGNQHSSGLWNSAWLLALLGTLTLVSQFYRNAINVTATTIAADLSLSAEQLGWLASGFFLTFSLCQIPVGMAIDRFGPRLAMAGSTIFILFGALLIAVSDSFAPLLIARMLLGLGCSTYFVAPLVIYGRTFAPSLFATLTGIQLGIGNLGTLLATKPLAWGTAQFGWRFSFIVPAVLALITSLIVFLVLRGPQTGPISDHRETLAETLNGVRRAMGVPYFKTMFLMQFCGYSFVSVLLGLWGAPMLAHVYGASLESQGSGMMLVVAIHVVGIVVFGSSDRWFNSYKIPVIAGLVLAALLTIAMAAVAPSLSYTGALVMLTAIGLCLAISPVQMAHGKALFPPELTGRGLTLLNIGTMGGAFTMQTVTGKIMQQIAGTATVYPVIGYQVILIVQAALLLFALAFYRKTPDPRTTMA